MEDIHIATGWSIERPGYVTLESMPEMTSLNIGGVPEHFNLPWHLAIEEGRFSDAGIDLHWVDCPGGTGEMAQGLAEGKLDLALPLSEGAVAGIARGVPMRILQWYVLSPLIWGIHVPAVSDIDSLEALRGQRFAISRYGSGSHLMAFVSARQMGWDPADGLRFVEVGNLDGAIESFRHGQAEGFLWERFTTQPYVDQGLMRRVGECPTPWPAFALAASERCHAR
jgi:ABC-type nitrate/sulfonate/bicarbonate transport system substrate-binding protein